MTEEGGYILGEDYPRPGRRVKNLIGIAEPERDEDGWLWYVWRGQQTQNINMTWNLITDRVK